MPKGHRTAVRTHSRTNSANRLPVTAQFTQKKIPPPRQRPQRPGFHIATHADDDDDEEGEDEEWTSESGAVTPNLNDDQDSDGPPEVPPELSRIPTARPADYFIPSEITTSRILDTDRLVQEPLTAPSSPTASRRHSRPLSTHSLHRPELRPHPLIRGQSFGQPCPAPKPSPLLPVAVTFDTDVHLSASPSVSFSDSPISPQSSGRRTSISSARSVATVATHQPPTTTKSRHRTFSSSSAVTSLTHLPAIHRPAPYITTFPASDPLQDDRIHPLLPPPYVANHLTVVSRRTPIRDALDRIHRARDIGSQIGVALTTFGGLFMLLGVMLFFDGALLALGNILFVSGITLIIGPKKTFYFFARKQKLRGSICFVGGIILVFLKWPFIGMIVETFGFLNLFGDFFPVIVTFLRQVPFLGTALSLPYIRDVVDRLAGSRTFATPNVFLSRVHMKMESFTELLLRRYDTVKAEYPSEHHLAWELRILAEFWASNPQYTPTPPGFNRPLEWEEAPNPVYERFAGRPGRYELGILLRTDYSNHEAWAQFYAKLQEAEADVSKEPVQMDDSDDDSDDETDKANTSIIKVVNPASEEDRRILTGITNITALRMFSDEVDVRPHPQSISSNHPLIDVNGLQEYYTGPTIWIFDAASNLDQCARLVYGQSDELPTAATGDSWRARVTHLVQLQIEIGPRGTLITFGGQDRYDYNERKRNLEEVGRQQT
ncbi:hypothetical protein MIND_00041000 [Mycena indigotica]|uniref:Uncharacterized protein n=1 Tax=Mycena indigotica TaxID=2126181 RepID=A0A8H6TEI0_9AGAR|nr:uncharacterized protein MIND_00041000 [Mycena indigotica]KAF7315266.1 hypothetical protein MIND_00041000 [Mycena indigotica]